MISARDELLHEGERNGDWVESFKVNLLDKKNRIFGFADINYLFQKKKMECLWAFVWNDNLYTSNTVSDFDGKPDTRSIAYDGFKYRIVNPQENFELLLKNRSINVSMKISGIYPVYVFPTTMPEDDEESPLAITLWNRYEQRCRISGELILREKRGKSVKKRFDGFGQREHSWGKRLMDQITCYSWITIQFRDMAMDLTYMEVGGHPVSNGVITKRTGNIPIVRAGLELINFNRENKTSLSTEFSYKDAQDDVDLVVSKRIHSVEIPVSRNKRGRFIRFRNFSEFTIIGTNKKGIGMEEHYISLSKLESME